jgi:hypothetical protein
MNTNFNTDSRQDFLNYIKPLLPDNPICIEIGVLDGLGSEAFLNILNPKKLYLVDPWEVGSDKNSNNEKYDWGDYTAYSNSLQMEAVENKFIDHINNGTICLKRGFSYDVVNDFPDDFFDFVYIDATHFYECVKKDISMFLPKLKRKGLMCGHDYYDIPSFSVIPAVDEYVDNGTFEWVALSRETDWALIRKTE